MNNQKLKNILQYNITHIKNCFTHIETKTDEYITSEHRLLILAIQEKIYELLDDYKRLHFIDTYQETVNLEPPPPEILQLTTPWPQSQEALNKLSKQIYQKLKNN